MRPDPRTAATTTPSSGPRRCGTRTTPRSTSPASTRSRSASSPGRTCSPPRTSTTSRRSTRSSSGPPPRAARSCWRPPTGAHAAVAGAGAPRRCRVDFEGRRHVYGQRHNSCPSARRRSARLSAGARRPARRSGTRTTRRSSRGTSATSTAAPATATCARRRSASGCASGTRTLDAAQRRVEHHVLVAHVHRLGRDRAADGPVRALARTEPHRVPGHHARLPAVHVRRAARRLPAPRRRRSARTSRTPR